MSPVQKVWLVSGPKCVLSFDLDFHSYNIVAKRNPDISLYLAAENILLTNSRSFLVASCPQW